MESAGYLLISAATKVINEGEYEVEDRQERCVHHVRKSQWKSHDHKVDQHTDGIQSMCYNTNFLKSCGFIYNIMHD